MKGRTVDVVITAVSLSLGLLMLATGQYTSRNDPGWLLLTLLACCAAVLLRRRAPLLSVLLGTAAVVADVAIGPSLAVSLIYTQVLYDACVHGSDRLTRVLLAGSVAVSVLSVAVALAVVRDVRGLAIPVLVALVTVLPVLTGLHVRHHRDQADAARQLARLAELDRAHAVAGERARMARELHDVIANHLSAVAIHATAALSADLGPDGTRAALTVIRENSVQGLAEMRQMIGFLRDPAAGDEATAGLASIDDLAERMRRSGLDVAVDVRGEPAGLSTAADLAAYRIVQESLTNALKHGDGPARVVLSHHREGVDLRITSPLVSQVQGTPGAGAGVVGMRERALLLGGTLTAHGADGQWLVAASLPRSAA